MAGVFLKYEVQGLKRLQEYAKKLSQFGPEKKKELNAEISSFLVRQTQDRFESKLTPTGRAWTSSLYRSGDLFGSIADSYNEHEAIAGTNIEYAAIHQFGGEAGRNKSVKIAANPFFGLSTEDEEEIVNVVHDFLEREVLDA
ncbi:MAG: phage virion morphogenesis protein [Alphaproteobacteria bacterium]